MLPLLPLHRFATLKIAKVAIERARSGKVFLSGFTAHVVSFLANFRSQFVALETSFPHLATIGPAVII
jgi:hypothetical protein